MKKLAVITLRIQLKKKLYILKILHIYNVNFFYIVSSNLLSTTYFHIVSSKIPYSLIFKHFLEYTLKQK